MPEVEKSYKKISFNHYDIKTYPKVLTDHLKTLFNLINVKKLIVISHFKMPFIGNIDNKYPPLQKAFKKFKTLTNDTEYSNAFETGINDLFSLVNIIFWIGRCDASGPEFVFFHDLNEKLSFNICKYGNVHVIEYGKEKLTKKLLNENGWYLIADKCFDQFSNDGRIKGRKMKI